MSTTTEGVSEALVDYSHTLRYEDIPPEVLERTKHMLLDFLGVSYGGSIVAESSIPIVEGVMELAAGASGRSRVLGRVSIPSLRTSRRRVLACLCYVTCLICLKNLQQHVAG